MSMRDSAGVCLSDLMKKISQYGYKSTAFKQIIQQNLLPAVKENMIHKDEVGKANFILEYSTNHQFNCSCSCISLNSDSIYDIELISTAS